MRKLWLMGFGIAVSVGAALGVGRPAGAADGFDDLGYNRTALLFRGAADGTDGVLDGEVWGDPTYAADQLKMKWSSDWQRGNDEGWNNPPYADAWIDNVWNGQVTGGSGESWQYRIIWVGTELEASSYWRDGGYPIWGQFEVILSHGMDASGHFWDAHAVATGFGGPAE